MKCEQCGMDNFDVSVTCVRCKKPLRSHSPQTKNPLFSSNPDPEPPTQISGAGLERVRFGPAPQAEHGAAQKMRTPRPTYQESIAAQEKNAPAILNAPPSSPSLPASSQNASIASNIQKQGTAGTLPTPSNDSHMIIESKNAPLSNILVLFLMLLLGASFVFFCADLYSLYCLLRK